MRTVIITPARYDSTRFPGKPLALLGGREIVLRVMDRLSGLGCHTVVATDDDRILNKVNGAGYMAVMTSREHRSGTDRVCEALGRIEELTGEKFDVVINVQGDEPFIDTEQIRLLERCFKDEATDIATLARPYPRDASYERLADRNLVKLVKGGDRALYFSRSVVPCVRCVREEDWPAANRYYTHIGIYGYRADVLRAISRLPQSPLEKAESLEQLRWLEAGYTIKVAESDSDNIGIDTPADLEAAERYLQQESSFGE